MLGDMFLWLIANLKQGVIYFIKQACGNDILASVYKQPSLFINKLTHISQFINKLASLQTDKNLKQTITYIY